MANSLFNHWDNLVAPVRNELVFEDRNKSYGAFDLRKNHNKAVAIALLITGASFVFAVSLPAIIDWLNNKTEEVEVPVDITPVDLTAPPPVDETEPPPPPPPPPPVMETVKFTPPVVTDEEVVDDPPPVQTEDTPQISTVTQEGTGGDEIIIPDEGTGTGVVEPVVEAPLTIVEQMPVFPGGDVEMMKYIQKNIQYPQVEKEAGISGTCYVTFVVEKDGNITDVKVLRGVSGGPGCDKEAMRVVKSMPNWKPGKQNGREVRVQFNLPIKFTLR
ncbi:MAG: TonB family protein [Bacteroidia bacterium]|nr:energy transducer TonB [Bacteroidia bacterium]MCK6648233.1 TonB family protein [Bacteroidia bacterium]